MEIDIEVCGLTGFQMGMECFHGQMEENIKEIFEMERKKGMEYSRSKDCFMKENLKMINIMVKVNYELMDCTNTKDNLTMGSLKDKEDFSLIMEKYMLESLRMDIKRDKVC